MDYDDVDYDWKGEYVSYERFGICLHCMYVLQNKTNHATTFEYVGTNISELWTVFQARSVG